MGEDDDGDDDNDDCDSLVGGNPIHNTKDEAIAELLIDMVRRDRRDMVCCVIDELMTRL
jgi:hypothetical protein